jgi:hypothetical protein
MAAPQSEGRDLGLFSTILLLLDNNTVYKGNNILFTQVEPTSKIIKYVSLLISNSNSFL